MSPSQIACEGDILAYEGDILACEGDILACEGDNRLLAHAYLALAEYGVDGADVVGGEVALEAAGDIRDWV